MARSIANISERDVYDWVYFSPVTKKTIAVTIPSNTCREFEDNELVDALLKQFDGILEENKPKEEEVSDYKKLEDIVLKKDLSLPDHLVEVKPKRKNIEEGKDPINTFQEQGFENGKNIDAPVKGELGRLGEAPQYTCVIRFCSKQFLTNEERKLHILNTHKENTYATRETHEEGKKDDGHGIRGT